MRAMIAETAVTRTSEDMLTDSTISSLKLWNDDGQQQCKAEAGQQSYSDGQQRLDGTIQ
jgi:hypothetical protein